MVSGSTLDERVAALDLVSHEFQPWEEVIDPGAGEQAVFDACIDELSGLIDELARVSRASPSEHAPSRGFVLAAAVGIVGVTFGVLADAAGLSLAQVVVMSALVFTGASQFAAVSVVDTGGSGIAAVGPALLLAARNALYGPVVARISAWRGFRERARRSS